MQHQTESMRTMMGPILAEGKTKIITQWPDDRSKVLLTAKDDITAFNGLKHDLLSGKAHYSTATTCNVFRFLKKCGLPVAFERQISATQFVAPKCEMILYEVVVRREAHGSFLKRHPYLKKGHVFPELMLEFFLKTKDQQWEGKSIPADDPFISFNNDVAELYVPNVPTWQQEPFMKLSNYPLCNQPEVIEQIGKRARQVFLALEKAWQLAGSKLVDFKLEFGFDVNGNLLIADVIDNDSWRVVHDGHYIDKQFYRDGAELDEVAAKYAYVAKKTEQFDLPKQQIIIWRGSVKDDVQEIIDYLAQYAPWISTQVITCSIHKDPVGGYQELTDHVQQIPNSVLLAFIGRSNGAGPTLSANTTIPVITIPVGWEKFPDDIWSSLRAPSNVPVMTVLDSKNACLAALQILSANNAALAMQLQTERLGRSRNIVFMP